MSQSSAWTGWVELNLRKIPSGDRRLQRTEVCASPAMMVMRCSFLRLAAGAGKFAPAVRDSASANLPGGYLNRAVPGGESRFKGALPAGVARGWRRLPPVAVCDPEGTCTLRLSRSRLRETQALNRVSAPAPAARVSGSRRTSRGKPDDAASSAPASFRSAGLGRV